MNIKGLKQAVKKLAKGKYHSVNHKITEYHAGEVEDKWSAYISDLDWTSSCDTPEEALKEMEQICSNSK